MRAIPSSGLFASALLASGCANDGTGATRQGSVDVPGTAAMSQPSQDPSSPPNDTTQGVVGGSGGRGTGGTAPSTPTSAPSSVGSAAEGGRTGSPEPALPEGAAGGQGGRAGSGGAAETPPPAGGEPDVGGNASDGGTGTADAGAGNDVMEEDVFVSEVFSGHPLAFALCTFQDRQFVAFYDAEQRMTVGSRTLGEDDFEFQVLPTSVGWDSHNYVAMAVDSLGHLHVAGNMHDVPLIYFRTTTALDVTTLTRIPEMVGTNESSVTYPEFFLGPSGNLIFIHRDGGSGNGNHIFDEYDAAASSWRRLLDTPLTDGEDQRNAYPVGPIQGSDGAWHLVWVWRDSPDAATNHDLSYAQSEDLVRWFRGSGQELALPITLASSDVVDPVASNGGIINNNTKVGFDAENRPIVAYHKYDASGATQLFNARLEDGTWVIHQTSRWDYRWDFGGTGTLVFEIEIEPIEAQPDGTLTQRYFHAEYGGWGAFRLDPETLEAIETIDAPLPYPPELDTPRSQTPEMVVRWQEDWGPTPDPDLRYLLRWETLPSNRDMPRNPVPPPTELRLYGFRR